MPEQDIATFGFAIESSQAKQAAEHLDHMADASERVEQRGEGVIRSSQEMERQWTALLRVQQEQLRLLRDMSETQSRVAENTRTLSDITADWAVGIGLVSTAVYGLVQTLEFGYDRSVGKLVEDMRWMAGQGAEAFRDVFEPGRFVEFERNASRAADALGTIREETRLTYEHFQRFEQFAAGQGFARAERRDLLGGVLDAASGGGGLFGSAAGRAFDTLRDVERETGMSVSDIKQLDDALAAFNIRGREAADIMQRFFERQAVMGNESRLLARQVGVSTGAVLEFREEMDRAGVTVAEQNRVFNTMAENLSGFGDQAVRARFRLSQLGISTAGGSEGLTGIVEQVVATQAGFADSPQRTRDLLQLLGTGDPRTLEAIQRAGNVPRGFEEDAAFRRTEREELSALRGERLRRRAERIIRDGLEVDEVGFFERNFPVLGPRHGERSGLIFEEGRDQAQLGLGSLLRGEFAQAGEQIARSAAEGLRFLLTQTAGLGLNEYPGIQIQTPGAGVLPPLSLEEQQARNAIVGIAPHLRPDLVARTQRDLQLFRARDALSDENGVFRDMPQGERDGLLLALEANIQATFERAAHPIETAARDFRDATDAVMREPAGIARQRAAFIEQNRAALLPPGVPFSPDQRQIFTRAFDERQEIVNQDRIDSLRRQAAATDRLTAALERGGSLALQDETLRNQAIEENRLTGIDSGRLFSNLVENRAAGQLFNVAQAVNAGRIEQGLAQRIARAADSGDPLRALFEAQSLNTITRRQFAGELPVGPSTAVESALGADLQARGAEALSGAIPNLVQQRLARGFTGRLTAAAGESGVALGRARALVGPSIGAEGLRARAHIARALGDDAQADELEAAASASVGLAGQSFDDSLQIGGEGTLRSTREATSASEKMAEAYARSTREIVEQRIALQAQQEVLDGVITRGQEAARVQGLQAREFARTREELAFTTRGLGRSAEDVRGLAAGELGGPLGVEEAGIQQRVNRRREDLMAAARTPEDFRRATEAVRAYERALRDLSEAERERRTNREIRAGERGLSAAQERFGLLGMARDDRAIEEGVLRERRRLEDQGIVGPEQDRILGDKRAELETLQRFREIEETSRAISNTLVGGLREAVSGAGDLDKMLRSTLSRMAAIGAEKMFFEPFGDFLSAGMERGFGEGGFLSNLFFASQGGIVGPSGPLPVRHYASGGVADTPQFSVFGEGSRPEAYVPLDETRRIPVAIEGGGVSQPQFNMSFVFQGDAGGQVRPGAGLDFATAQAVQQEIQEYVRVAINNEMVGGMRSGGFRR